MSTELADPLKELLGFHKRIRLALNHLDELSRRPMDAIAPIEVRALFDFFDRELRAHDVDEEASLMPRLRRVEHPPRLERLLDGCTLAHREMEALIGSALPHLKAVAEERILPDARLLGEVAQRLRSLLEPHLTIEEQEVFPLARLLLDEGDLEEMSSEMAARHAARTPPREPGAEADGSDLGSGAPF